MSFRNSVYKTLYDELSRAKDLGLPVAGARRSATILVRRCWQAKCRSALEGRMQLLLYSICMYTSLRREPFLDAGGAGPQRLSA